MPGNEILLNLENSKYLRNGELISSLISLANKDKAKEHDWEMHPWVKTAFEEIDQRIPRLGPKNLIQIAIAMDRLRYEDTAIFHKL